MVTKILDIYLRNRKKYERLGHETLLHSTRRLTIIDLFVGLILVIPLNDVVVLNKLPIIAIV